MGYSNLWLFNIIINRDLNIMTIKSKLLYAVKCGFLILLLTSASAMVFLIFFPTKYLMPSEKISDDNLIFKPRPKMNFSMNMLDDNFDWCLSSSLILDIPILHSTSKSSLFHAAHTADLISSQKIKTEPILKIAKMFADSLYALFETDVVLMEPSILFCMLTPQHKQLLLRRNFYLKQSTNQRRVLTFGVRAEHVTVLENPDFLEKMEKRGFSAEFVIEERPYWMDTANETESQSVSFYTSHIFYKSKVWTIHVVVLHRRGNFLWHAALPNRLTQSDSMGELHFSETDSAYENFSFVSLGFKEDYLSNILIPSNPQYFLFEMSSSRFLECNRTIVADFNKQKRIRMKKKFLFMPVRQFKRRTIKGLQEMKAIFTPLLMHLWIWSGTMLGWYRQCGIIPYTTDVDFAAWASEVDDLDELVRLIRDSKHIKLIQRMGVAEQALEFYTTYEKLRMDVFFMYQENNGTWCAGHRPSQGYYFKCYDPNFTLCSGELLGQKVTVPCETERVIAFDYGPNWIKPVVMWDYETSVKNRGPNIYWNETMLKKVYWDHPNIV